MSTRCNVIIKDGKDKLIFYRHSDGYPEGVKATLDQFVDYMKTGKIRDNIGQAAGWLILIGHEEYAENNYGGLDWKVGAYEPTTSIHGDIEHLYVIDLPTKSWKEVDITAKTVCGFKNWSVAA